MSLLSSLKKGDFKNIKFSEVPASPGGGSGGPASGFSVSAPFTGSSSSARAPISPAKKQKVVDQAFNNTLKNRLRRTPQRNYLGKSSDAPADPTKPIIVDEEKAEEEDPEQPPGFSFPVSSPSGVFVNIQSPVSAAPVTSSVVVTASPISQVGAWDYLLPSSSAPPPSVFRPNWAIYEDSSINTPELVKEFLREVVPPADHGHAQSLSPPVLAAELGQSLYRMLQYGAMAYQFLGVQGPRVVRFERRLAEADDRVANLHKLVASLESSLAKEGEQVNVLRRQLEDAQLEVGELEMAKQETVALKKKVDELESVLKEERAKAAETEARMKSIDSEHAGVMSSLEKEVDRLKSLTAPLVDERARLADERRWMIGEGARLVYERDRSCREYHSERDALNRAIFASGLHVGIETGYEHFPQGLPVDHVPGYDADALGNAEALFVAYNNFVPSLFQQLADNPDLSVEEIKALTSVVDPATPSPLP